MNLSNLWKKTEEKDFISFPSTLETYAWYKPIIVMILALIITIGITFVLAAIIHIGPTGDRVIQIISLQSVLLQ